MVCNYKKIKEDPKWSDEEVKNAILSVIQGEKCATVAASIGMPRTTLQSKVKNYKKKDKELCLVKCGPNTVFTIERKSIW